MDPKGWFTSGALVMQKPATRVVGDFGISKGSARQEFVRLQGVKSREYRADRLYAL